MKRSKTYFILILLGYLKTSIRYGGGESQFIPPHPNPMFKVQKFKKIISYTFLKIP